MQKIAELAGRELTWRQPSMGKMEYELLAGEELAGTVRFRSMWGSFATGESADGCWTFKRVGFWKTRATVRVCGAETNIAEYHNNTWSSGGTLTLPDTRHFQVSANLWQTQVTLTDDQEQALLRYTNSGVLRASGRLAILGAAHTMPELPWVVMFGWYLIVMMSMDAAATTGAVAALS